MISGKAKEEAGLESDNSADEDKILNKIRDNVERLQQIMTDTTEETDNKVTHVQSKKVLH